MKTITEFQNEIKASACIAGSTISLFLFGINLADYVVPISNGNAFSFLLPGALMLVFGIGALYFGRKSFFLKKFQNNDRFI